MGLGAEPGTGSWEGGSSWWTVPLGGQLTVKLALQADKALTPPSSLSLFAKVPSGGLACCAQTALSGTPWAWARQRT